MLGSAIAYLLVIRVGSTVALSAVSHIPRTGETSGGQGS
jgi:hypothetical protein